MYSKQSKKIILDNFKNEVEECLSENLSNLSFARDVDTLKGLVLDLQEIMEFSISQVGLDTPKINTHVTCTGKGSDITFLNIAISSKKSCKTQLKFKENLSLTSDDFIMSVANYLFEVYSTLLEGIMVDSNLEVVNKVLQELCSKAELSYNVEVVSYLQNSKKIQEITDSILKLVADSENIFDLDDIILLSNTETGALLFDRTVDIYKSAQTVVQFLEARGFQLISWLCGIKKAVKPINMIKKVYQRNAKNLVGGNDTYAYYLEDGIFSVVERVNGNLKVVLQPFDCLTYKRVDYDVLGKLG